MRKIMSGIPGAGGRPSGRGPLAEALMLGTNMVVAVAVFAFLGHWVDSRRGGGDFWTLVGAVVGLAVAGYEVWKVVRMLNAEDRGGRRGDRGKNEPHGSVPHRDGL